MSKQISISQEDFDRTARMALEQWDDARFDYMDSADITSREGFEQALADMRSLLFNYVS